MQLELTSINQETQTEQFSECPATVTAAANTTRKKQQHWASLSQPGDTIM